MIYSDSLNTMNVPAVGQCIFINLTQAMPITPYLNSKHGLEGFKARSKKDVISFCKI